jgi:hypothetical protein
MPKIPREERSNICRHDEAGIIGNEAKMEPSVRRAPGWKTGANP